MCPAGIRVARSPLRTPFGYGCRARCATITRGSGRCYASYSRTRTTRSPGSDVSTVVASRAEVNRPALVRLRQRRQDDAGPAASFFRRRPRTASRATRYIRETFLRSTTVPARRSSPVIRRQPNRRRWLASATSSSRSARSSGRCDRYRIVERTAPSTRHDKHWLTPNPSWRTPLPDGVLQASTTLAPRPPTAFATCVRLARPRTRATSFFGTIGV